MYLLFFSRAKYTEPNFPFPSGLPMSKSSNCEHERETHASVNRHMLYDSSRADAILLQIQTNRARSTRQTDKKTQTRARESFVLYRRTFHSLVAPPLSPSVDAFTTRSLIPRPINGLFPPRRCASAFSFSRPTLCCCCCCVRPSLPPREPGVDLASILCEPTERF